MNKIRFYFTLSAIAITLFSCNKKDDDSSVIQPPRDRAEQYAADIDSIEGYLKTHYITKVEVDGFTDVVITKIPSPNPSGFVSIWDNSEYPLQSKIVKNDSRVTNFTDGRIDDQVEYKMYYLILNEGAKDRPVTVDSTFTTYRGWTLDNKEFDKANTPYWSTFPVVSTGEQQFISGYRQFLPLLKSAASTTTNDDGTITFNDSGVGVVFIASGLGYFNTGRTGIPVYSPLAFLIRLHTVRTRDHDRDGIMTIFEDLNNDHDFYNDDTDGDLIPDFLDIDDDGDTYFTRDEVKDPDGKVYPFALIPNCPGGTIKRHLDKTCHQ